jgi:hypothetical protein
VSSLNATPLLGLPYPNGLDRPCDFDDSWCTFTAAIDALFTTWEAAINRTTPAVPFAMLQMTTVMNIGNNNLVPFDTVVADTAGMTDLDSDLYGITIPRTGRYTVAYGFNQQSGLVVNAQIDGILTGSVAGQLVSHLTLDRGTISGPGYGNMADYDAVTLMEGERVTFSTFESGANSRVLLEAWMAVYWHSDQEVP